MVSEPSVIIRDDRCIFELIFQSDITKEFSISSIEFRLQTYISSKFISILSLKLKIALVLGTRPEIIKMAPVIYELEKKRH